MGIIYFRLFLINHNKNKLAYLAFEEDFDGVVVSVSVGVVALAVELPVGFLGELWRVQPMRGREGLPSAQNHDWSLRFIRR